MLRCHVLCQPGTISLSPNVRPQRAACFPSQNLLLLEMHLHWGFFILFFLPGELCHPSHPDLFSKRCVGGSAMSRQRFLSCSATGEGVEWCSLCSGPPGCVGCPGWELCCPGRAVPTPLRCPTRPNLSVPDRPWGPEEGDGHHHTRRSRLRPHPVRGSLQSGLQ